MSKTRDTGYLANVIQVHDTGVRIMSGSTMLMAVSSSGAVTITGEISGSDAANALLLSGTGSVGFTTTASFLAVSSSQQQVSASYTALSGSYNTFSGSASTRITENSSSIQQVSSSQQQISSSLLQVSASYISLSGGYNTFSGSASTRITVDSASLLQVSSSQQQISASLLNVISIFATTGSNSFRANQSITGSLVVSSTITAQTLVVQTVTSSIVYSSGSNIFGSALSNTQTFTGSMFITGSNIFANVGIACFAGRVYIGTDKLCWTDTTFKTIQVGNGAFNNISNQTQIVNNIYYDDTNYRNLIAGAANRIIMNTSGDFSFEYACAATAGSALTLSSRFYICGINGRVGIGENAPLSSLVVATPSDTTSLGQSGIVIEGTSTLTAGCVMAISFTAIPGTIRARAAVGSVVGSDWGKGNLTFYTRDASDGTALTTADERMRIASDGNVGIGCISPAELLEVSGSLKIGNLKIQNSDGGRIGFNRNTSTGAIYNCCYAAFQINGAYSGADYLDFQNYNSSGSYVGGFVLNNGNVGIGCTSPGVSLVVGRTDGLKLPTGTTAQRPTGASGLIRMNSTTGQPEWYDSISSSWVSFASQIGTCTYDIQYLVVGGGGGGGMDRGGAGGAGGYRLACTTLISGTSYYAIIGAGGASNSYGTQGGRSAFNAIVSIGGGAGGSGNNGYAGTDGGSGGGGGNSSGGCSNAAGAGTTGQGNAGGSGVYVGPNYGAGGGGGAGAVGANGTSTVSGNGGDGCQNSICGVSRYYAGGGGAGAYGGGTLGLGGAGGGGNGTVNAAGCAGAANSGGGGGSEGSNSGGGGGVGGSGIVIIRYCGSQRGSGGTIVSCNGHTIHIFSSSTMYTA